MRAGTGQSEVDRIIAEGTPVEDAGDDWIHMLLYGRNRIGKTTLACQFPKPLALISVEPTPTGGAKSVRKIEGVTHYRYHTSAQVERLGNAFKVRNPFQTIVIDSGTSLDEIVLAEICGWSQTAEMLKWGQVSQDQYRERSERMRKVLRAFLDLPCHVIIICNEKDHNPQEGRKNPLTRSLQSESFFAAAMGGGTTRWVQDGCDYLCQLYMDKETVKVRRKVGKTVVVREEETGRQVRRLRTAYHVNYAAGIRSENPEAVPDFVQADSSAEMYEKFMAVVRGEPLEAPADAPIEEAPEE